MMSINLSQSPHLTALITCSVREEQREALIDHITHFLETDTRHLGCLSITFVAPPFQHLSAREFEVLRFVAEGYSNPEIANQLNLSPNTVKTHVRNLLNKFGVDRRIHLVAIAMTIDPAKNIQ